MAIMLAIVLGLSAILTRQIKTVRNIGYSVVAFYAAETGIEKELMDNHGVGYDSDTSVPLCTICYIDLDGDGMKGPADAPFHITIFNGVSCPGANYCVKSVGSYKETRRAIQVSR